MLARQTEWMSTAEFLDAFSGAEGKWELVRGVPRMMSGGTAAHNSIAANILTALRGKLRGTGCKPFNSDMGLEIADGEVRYPDLAIYCDPRDLALDPLVTRVFRHPSVLFEILSPSTERYDRGQKIMRYHDVQSLRTVILVDPATRLIEVYEREEGGWSLHRQRAGADLDILDPAVTLTHDEIFATN